MNKFIFQGTWHQLKGKVKQKWAELTDDDLAALEGSLEEISGLLQKKYGYNKEKAEEEVHEFFKKFDA